jgi:cyanophycin synthetase
MKLLTLRALRGPNVWLDRPAVELSLELTGDLSNGVGQELHAWAERDYAPRRNASIFSRLRASPQANAPELVVHLVAWLVFELQPGLADCVDQVTVRPQGSLLQGWVPPGSLLPGSSHLGSVQHGSLHQSSQSNGEQPGRNLEWRVVVPYAEENVARGAVDAAMRALEQLLAACRGGSSLVGSAVSKQVIEDLEAAALALEALDAEVRLGPSTGGIVRAAQRRGIPVKRLTEGSLVQFGHGIHQRRIWAAETDQTSALAEQVAQDKELTKALLFAAGIPVPEGAPVASADEAWALAQQLGLPVVIKPRDGNQGRDVSVNLRTEESVRQAFTIVRTHDHQALIERHVEGDDFRLLVVGDRLIAAARREPPRVEGDGVSTVEELVRLTNLDPRRGDDHSNVLSKIRLDEIALEVLAEQALTPSSVPAPGQRVSLRRNANLSTGGTATDVTDEVHPEVAAMAVAAAHVVGLDIAGIDLVALAVNRPLSETRGAIVEVNAAPGLRMHIEPSAGKGRPVGAAIIDMMFPPGQTARIPIVAITGTNGKTTTTRAIAHLFKQHRWRVGMTCTDGIYVEGRRIEKGDCAGPKSARVVLAHPRVEAAVLETARGGMLREGLGFDWCDVAVVTNIGEGDHLGLNAIETKEELARVKSLIVRRVSKRGAAVLNADDPLVVAMADSCQGTVVFFSRNPDSPVLSAHRARGGQVVTVRDGVLVVEQGNSRKRFGRVADMPLTHRGRVGFQIDNLLAVTAAALWVGLAEHEIAAGLASFSSDLGIAPGRFNVLEHKGSTVIVDYGHNADALMALGEAISRFEHNRRKVVYTAAGDRRDEDIRRQGQILADFFDEIFIYEDQCTRGRADGQIMRLMREGFAHAKQRPIVRQLGSEMSAIGAAVHSLSPGDLLLCQIDQVETALEYLTGLLTSEPEVRAPARASTKSSPSIGLLNAGGGGTDPSGARRSPR